MAGPSTTLLLLLLAVPAAPAVPPAPPPPAPDPHRLLARLGARDPPVSEVQAAAAREAERATPDPTELAARRRTAAWLPTLTLEAKADQQTNRVVGLQGSGEVDYARSSPGTSVTVRATWELGDLVATRSEPVAASAALTRLRRRDEAVRRATHLYFERRRLLLLLALEPPVAPLALADTELDLARASAELEALTGGILARRGGP
jgi:hypothetical protein